MQYNISTRAVGKKYQVMVGYKNHEGQWKYRTKAGFDKVKDAKHYGETVIVPQLKKQYCKPRNSELDGITFLEFTNLHKDHLRLYWSVNTMDLLDVALVNFQSIHDKPIDKITSLDIQLIVNDMARLGLSYSTTKSYLARISAIFKAAIKYKLIEENPIKDIEIIKDKDKSKSQKALTQEETKVLLDSFKKSKYYNLIYTLRYSGLRLGEALGLTVKDIDFENRELNINKQWQILENGEYGFSYLKSTNSLRKVPIAPHLAELLTQIVKDKSKDDRVFNYAKTKAVISKLSQDFKAKELGYNLHSLRHSYVTDLLANNIDPKSVSTIAGHDISQTMKIYSHMNNDMLEKAKRVIDSAL